MSHSHAPEDPIEPRPEEDPRPIATGPTDYGAVPWYRRNNYCSAIILAHLFMMCCGAGIPVVSLLGFFTTLGVIAICIVVLTGPVYYNKRRKDGSLKSWSGANKVAAVILLILFVGGYVALLVVLFTGGQFG